VTELSEAPRADGSDSRPVEVSVSLFGLIGATGVLPEHYTELLIRRLRLKDRALLEFLDLFNHRAVSLLYRAWGKYRLPVRHERAARDRGEENDVDRVLWSLIGFGTAGVRRSGGDVKERAYLYYSGHLARRIRPAGDLESFLGDYFDLPVRVRQFRGHWLFLPQEDCTRLHGSEGPGGWNNRLGQDALLGDRVWDVQGKFRLSIGPVGYDRYLDLLPGTGTHRAFRQLVRTFVGPELDFDIELVLKAAEAPPCHLGGAGRAAPHLGWNTWLHTRAAPLDVPGAVFRVEEV
jgi:type VI secretion system protein ImpH